MSLGDFLYEDMQKNIIGVKGTPSEKSIETLGDMVMEQIERGGEIRPEKKGWLPSWAKWPVDILTAGASTLGDFVTRGRREGKPLVTQPAQEGRIPYEQKARELLRVLRNHDYNSEDRQQILNILAKGYGREPLNESDFTY